VKIATKNYVSGRREKPRLEQKEAKKEGKEKLRDRTIKTHTRKRNGR